MNSNYYRPQPSQSQRLSRVASILAGASLVVSLFGCTTVTTNKYEATATTTYTWQVEYLNSSGDNQLRFEEFAKSSLVNRNGLKPERAVIGPDARELWWPAIPPRPTLDEIEQRTKPYEKASAPQLVQSVDYKLTYNDADKEVTLPTNYDVYREVAKVYPSQASLQLTLGLTDSSVEKAEPEYQ